MIPADQIAFDGDTAWWVKNKPTYDGADGATLTSLDRPCDTCDGTGANQPDEDYDDINLAWATDDDTAELYDCTGGCDGTGRHTFTIEVSFGVMTRGFRIHRVSVVPGMVLPIVADADDLPDCPPLIEMDDGGVRFFDEGVVETNDAEPITLPPAAAPGMWAVKLRIVNGANPQEPTARRQGDA